MAGKHYTIKDLAREAGVSPALVSFALNNTGANGEKRYKVNKDTARRIEEIAAAHNYKPNSVARSLRSRRSRTIGVILSDISNSFFSEIARRIENEAYKVNYSVLFGSTDESVEKLEAIINTFLDKSVDGLIIVPCERSEEVIAKIVKRDIPLVLLDRNIESLDVNRVLLDNEKAAEMAVEALLNNGNRRVEMISYQMNLSNITKRESGYRKSVESRGLVPVVHNVNYNNINESMEELMRTMDFKEVDALLFATNSLAVAGIKTLGKLGIAIPDEVSVVVFDGSEAFDLYPISIAYIRQPISDFAQQALRLVIGQINDSEAEKESIILQPAYVAGESAIKR